MPDPRPRSDVLERSYVASRFVVAGEVLACDQHAKVVGDFAHCVEADESCDERMLAEVDESLRCFECRLIVAATFDDALPSAEEDQRALEAFLRSRKSAVAPSVEAPSHLGLTLGVRSDWRRSVLATPSSGRFLAFVAMAASVLLALGSILVWQNYSLRREARSLEASNATLQADLPRERLELTSHSGPAPRSDAVLPSLVAVTLLPGLSRSIAPADGSSVELTTSTRSISVSLALEGSDYIGDYEATVEAPDGTVVHRAVDLKGTPSVGPKRTVTFIVPARVLAPGGYIVRLEGIAGTGASGVVNHYRLLVISPPKRADSPGGTVLVENDTGGTLAIAVAGQSAVVAAHSSAAVALPSGEFPATILSICGTLTRSVTVQIGLESSMAFQCVR